MKKIIVLLAALCAALSVAAQTADPYPSYIQVTGRTEKEVAPDEFYLSIEIDEHDTKGRQSIDEQQRQMVAALRRIGIDVDKQLKVANLQSEFFKRNASLSTARYQLKLTTSAQVSSTYEALSKIGISNVSIQRVSRSDLDALRSQARAEAIRNAQQCARTLAEAVGQQIGPCFWIVDYNNDSAPMVYDNALFARGAAANESASAADDEPIDFKTIRLTYSVQAKFVLK